jgi:glycosyltransferase involved in cell wall biosynthesis
MILYEQIPRSRTHSTGGWTLAIEVVMIGPYAIYPYGTVPLRMLPMAEALHSKGHSVSIILPPYNNMTESGREYNLRGVKIYNVSIPDGFNIRTSSLMKHMLIANSVVHKALELRPKLIHVFVPAGISGLSAMLLVMRKWLRLANIPIILDIDDWFGYGGFFDSFLAQKSGVRYRLVKSQQDWLLKHISVITTASKTLQSLVWSLGVSPNRVFYLPNGPHQFETASNAVDVKNINEAYGLENKQVVLLYTKFSELNVKRVIDIVKIARREQGDLTLLIIGKGEFHEEEALLQLAAKNGLEESVVYVGWVAVDKLPSYFSIADIAIYPFKDSLLNRAKCPGKLVELMSLGKAIVADKVGQIAEYIQDEKSGMLVEAEDTYMFAQSLIRVLQDSELRKKLGENARERIWRDFNWNELTSVVEEAYKVAISTERL